MTEKDFWKLQNGNDIRGIAVEGVEGEEVNLTPEAVNRIASGFVKFLSEKLNQPAQNLKIAIGHDSRISAPQLLKSACESLTASGVEVLNCGLASTPAMFMSIVFDEIKADGSIMLTASHLPFNRNGLKFFTRDGGLEKSDITIVLKNAIDSEVVKGDIDSAKKFDLISIYAEHLKNVILKNLNLAPDSKPFAGMKIIVDAGNGSGGFFASKILEPLGADISGSQFLEPNGLFPNHIPNPEDEEAMASVKKAVLENHADLGLIFDTDVDRGGAVLSDGKEIARNALVAMMAAILAPDYPKSTIVTDSVTSDELHVFLEKNLGLKHHRFKRGYKNVINECIRLNKSGEISPLAIETSGHGALSENYFLDDGAYLAVKILIAAAKLHRENKNLSDLIADLKYPAESKEFRLKIVGQEDAGEYGERVLKTFIERAEKSGIKQASPNFEGVRLIFDNGWASLRASLHEPKLQFNIESREIGGCKKIIAVLKNFFKDFDSVDLTLIDQYLEQ